MGANLVVGKDRYKTINLRQCHGNAEAFSMYIRNRVQTYQDEDGKGCSLLSLLNGYMHNVARVQIECKETRLGVVPTSAEIRFGVSRPGLEAQMDLSCLAQDNGMC